MGNDIASESFGENIEYFGTEIGWEIKKMEMSGKSKKIKKSNYNSNC